MTSVGEVRLIDPNKILVVGERHRRSIEVDLANPAVSQIEDLQVLRGSRRVHRIDLPTTNHASHTRFVMNIAMRLNMTAIGAQTCTIRHWCSLNLNLAALRCPQSSIRDPLHLRPLPESSCGQRP